MKITIIALALCYVAYVNAETPVEHCPNTSPTQFKQIINIGNCRKTPCRLRKKSIIKGEFKFTPVKANIIRAAVGRMFTDRNVEKITNTVNAIIVGLPFPFIGVDNVDACGQIYELDGTTKTGCPLKAGKEYIYKNEFEVKEIYPRLKLVVHWGLTANDGKDVMCFQIPAKITN